MKKIILSLNIILMMGCNIAYEVLDEYYESDMKDHNLYYSEDFEDLETIHDIVGYLRHHIEYSEHEGYQDLEVSLNTGVGNCTSFSIGFANIYYYVFGEECNIIIVNGYESREVVKGGFDGNHAIIELPDGTQIEPQNGELRFFEVQYRYEFDLVF